MRLGAGTSRAVTMVNSSQGTPPSKRIPRIRPRGFGTADRDAVQHARHRQVVDVARLAGDFRAAFLAWNGATHHRHGHDDGS